MTSSVLSTAHILTLVVGLATMTISRMMSTKVPTSPPQVGSLFPWVGSALGLIFRPSGFLALCQTQYGPVFKVLAGGLNIIVVSSPDSLASVAFADHRVLSSHVQHYAHFRALCGGSSLRPKIYDTLVHKIFPILDRSLSKRTLGDVTPPFAQVVFDKLKLFSGSPQVSLARSLTEPLYTGANVVLFGNRFPQDTYDDSLILLNSLPKRLSMRPFWSLPSSRARDRLLQRISDYLDGANPATGDKLADSFTTLFREHDIPIEVAAPSILLTMSSLQQNATNVVFWLFTWLLADPSALAAVRNEIDKAVREVFGDFQSFIAEVTPEKLDTPSFALLNSAILETMRLTSVQTGMRLVASDLDIKDRGKTVPIRKGEYVLLDPRGAHRDKNSYPDGDRFVVSRFVQSEYQGDLAATAGYPYFALGAGKHVCKGRFLAMYEIKVLTVMYLSLFDVTPVTRGDASATWGPPQPSPRSAGTMHPVEDVFVRLRPRSIL
ncbi:cytochrome P450 [Pisolithus marmoratus]|nr:cytochrome P450 [Pisolithus marmoratus]